MGHWLHSIPRQKEVIGDRINPTFRKYNLSKDRVNVQKLEEIDVDDIKVPKLLRAVSYVCMVPKTKVQSLGLIRQRILAFESKSTCSHSPHDGRVHCKPSGLKGQSINDVEDKLIRSLIGVDMMETQWKPTMINGNNKKEKKKKKNKKQAKSKSIKEYPAL